jgi:hypothetical protein
MKIPTPGEYKAQRGIAAHDVSRSHGIWQRSTILRILEDERFTGMYIIGKRTVAEVGSKKILRKDESEWVKIPNHHSAIIDKALYDEVQLKIGRFNAPKRKSHVYPLKSKVVCGCCEHVMSRAGTRNNFFCRHSSIDKSYKCHGLKINESELERLLFGIISKQAEVLLNKGDRTACNGTLELHSLKKSEYDSLIQSTHERKRRLYEQFVSEEVTESEYKEAKARIDTELSNLKRIKSSVLSDIQESQTRKEEIEKNIQAAVEIKKAASLTKPLSDMLIDKVIVFPDNRVEVVWRFDGFK